MYPFDQDVTVEEEEPRVISILDPLNSFTSTLLTANLATAIARYGNKVLVVDLNFSQPTLSILLGQELSNQLRTNDAYLLNKTFSEVLAEAFVQNFPSGGLISFCLASNSIKQRIAIQYLGKGGMKKALSRLLAFIAEVRQSFDYIFLNMPMGTDFRVVVHGTMVSDVNVLLLDHEKISLSYGLELVTNLESIHPLIEFKGLMVHRFHFMEQEEERTYLENNFQLPVIALLPELPSYHSQTSVEMILDDPNPYLLKYYRSLATHFCSFVQNPSKVTPHTSLIEVIIIANEAGIPLFNAYIRGQEVLNRSEILASAALTAIVTGISSALREISRSASGETKLIKQKNISIVIEHSSGELPLRAMMLTGQEEELVRPKLRTFLQAFERRFATEIQEFHGNITKFQEAYRLVGEIF